MKKHKKLIITPFLTKCSKAQAKDLFKNSPEWKYFAERITNSKTIIEHLAEIQRQVCPICGQLLHTASEKNSVHHLSYEHCCSMPTASFSKRIYPERCNYCLKNFLTDFEKCTTKLILVHNRCHKSLHSK
jgi:hypothetical protein